jgi:D-arabinan endo alpha-(1,5)-arabinofuranosidase
MGEQTRPNGRTRRLAALVVAAATVVVFTVGQAALAAPVPPVPAVPTATTPVAVQRSATAKVADLIGTGSANDTGRRYGVEGTDLGHMFMVGGRMAMAFGDTFGGPAAKDFYSVPHSDWRSNVIASIDPPASPAAGLPFRGMITDRPGHAKELIPSKKVKGVQETVIPTYGIATGPKNATMNLQYMSVQSFDQPGHWRLTGSGIASSTDGGVTWKDQPTARWPANSKFGQVAYVRPGGPDDPKAPVPAGSAPGDTIYVYGIPGGRYGDLSLAKVPAAQLTDAAAYRYWNGTTWTAGEASAVPVVKGPVGELSVRWSSYYKRWIMMYLVDDTGEIVLRTASAPTGPWGPAQVVTTTKDFPKAYAPYLTPRWTDGPDLWFTMSQFTTYRVELMRARLAVLPAGATVPKADLPQSLPARSPSLSAPPVPQPAAAPASSTPAAPTASPAVSPASTSPAAVATSSAAAPPSTIPTVAAPPSAVAPAAQTALVTTTTRAAPPPS